MLHWITLTADMLTEVIDRAELEAITAADTEGHRRARASSRT